MKRKRIQLYSILLLAFLLGNYNGYIALWTKSTTIPARIFPYPVSSLPLSDQEAVEKGIYLRTEGELRQILEDYLS